MRLDDLVAELAADNAGVFAPETVRAECERAARLWDVVPGDDLPGPVAQSVRHRLSAIAAGGPVRRERRPVVVFVCVHNAGRSQMAAALLEARAGDAVEVRSAGSSPAEQVNPVAVEAMAELGLDIAERRPARLELDTVRAADVVVTMGCGDACPVVPGTAYEDWAVDDPAGQPIDVVRGIRDDIAARVERLVARLLVSPG